MAEPYCFGRFMLDPMGAGLYADGVPVPLGSTDLRLLLALVESRGDLVPKDELMSRVWGSRAVGENALYVHINALRRALGEGCILNKQGCGYRFVAPVEKIRPELASRVEKPAGNLPKVGRSRLIGRGAELRALAELIAPGRIVTLTGPGGVGKSRLALAAAAAASAGFTDGVWLVELATVTGTASIPAAIATALGIKIGNNVTPQDALKRYLAHRSLLVLLDNCEHVIGEAAPVAETLLASGPAIALLATSREPLSCAGEQVFEVPPLQLPYERLSGEELRKIASVDLFVERATNADASFRIRDEELATAASICRRVDGLPLAIEMAAAWAGALGLETLDSKLDGSLEAWLRARSTAPARHSTMRATLEWSHGLLSASEQALLRRVATFAGSFSIPAAEYVATGGALDKNEVCECIANLVRKSMIAVMPAAGVQRYHLLQTTRAFMLEQLEASGEETETRKRHAQYVLEVLEGSIRELEFTRDADWIEKYSPLLDDVRVALEWATETDADTLPVSLAGASWLLWRELSLRTEGRQRLSAAATRLNNFTPAELEARLRYGLGEMSSDTAAVVAAHSALERAATLYRNLGHNPELGRALSTMAFTLAMLDRIEEAKGAIREGLTLLEPAGWLRTLARAYSTQLCIEAMCGRFDEAMRAGERGAHLAASIGADRTALGIAGNMVQLHLETGYVDRAIAEGKLLAAKLHTKHHPDLYGFVLGLLVAALTERGDLGEALILARQAVPLLRDDDRLYWLFDHLALRAALTGRAKDGALTGGYANAVHQQSGRAREPMGRHAAERTSLLIREVLSESEIAELRRLGAQLSEEQALAVALSD